MSFNWLAARHDGAHDSSGSMMGTPANASHDHDTSAGQSSTGHGQGEMSHSGAMGHIVIFNNNMRTALFSAAWTPNNMGQYIGTCIFLVVLAVLFRAVMAAKALQEQKWLDQEVAKNFHLNAAENIGAAVPGGDLPTKRMTIMSDNGIPENVMVVGKSHTSLVRPWRWNVEPVRALLDVVVAFLGYMLMLAVMTMNVGFFISVLIGTFIGSIVCGRYAPLAAH